MSLVIAIKDTENNRVVLGSDRQATLGGNSSHNATKIWNMSGVEGCIMGGVGYVRPSQVIQYADDLIDFNMFPNGKIDMDDKFIINYLVLAIQTKLELMGIKGNLGDEDSAMPVIPNSFIVAFKDKCWIIGNDLSVAPVEDDFIVMGSGADHATGVLEATKGEHPFARIGKAISITSKYVTTVDDNIDILVTTELENDQAVFDALFVEDSIECECGHECECTPNPKCSGTCETCEFKEKCYPVTLDSAEN